MTRRFVAVLVKETREIWRDPYTLGMAIVLPLVMLFLFAYASNLDVKNVPLSIYDQDQTRASRDYVAQLTTGEEFHIHSWVWSTAELERLMDRDTIEVGLIIPPGFGETLKAGRPATVQTWLDGSFPPTANVVIGYTKAFNQVYSAKRIATLTGRTPRPAIAVEPRVWYNPGLKSINSGVPGLFAVILLAFPPLLSALAGCGRRSEGASSRSLSPPSGRRSCSWAS